MQLFCLCVCMCACMRASVCVDRYFMDPSLNEDPSFIIEPDSGLIRTTYILDREDTPLHNITVSAAEIGRWPFNSVCVYVCVC